VGEGDWSIGAMVLTSENRNTLRKVCPIATLATTIFIRTDLGSNPDLGDVEPVHIIKWTYLVLVYKVPVRTSQRTACLCQLVSAV
jgi:hypothetical protein